jgi:hypothetical protein
MENGLRLSEGNGRLSKSTNRSSTGYTGPERRSKLRLYGPFPAKVRGVDVNGKIFKVETVLDNISAGGLYLRLRQRLEPDAILFVVTRLSASEVRAPRVAVRGKVLRIEQKPDGECGVAVKITRHRFI